jgi:hypothetical protein
MRNYLLLKNKKTEPIKKHVFTLMEQEAEGFVVLDETGHLRHKVKLEAERTAKLTAAGNYPKANEELMREYGRYQGNLSKKHYERMAARVANLCKRNQIGHLLIAGNAMVNAWTTNHEGKAAAIKPPARQFFTLTQRGPRKMPGGTLVNALRRAGVNIAIASARARNIWMKPYADRLNQATGEEKLALCLPTTNFRLKAGMVMKTGTKRLTARVPGQTAVYPYALNAAWAILLD